MDTTNELLSGSLSRRAFLTKLALAAGGSAAARRWLWPAVSKRQP
jgi:hypothetical protein